MKVSVIIPTHNRSKLLKRSINSVLQQTYTNLECIVVDDASTDNTVEIIESINDNRLVYLSHKTNRHASASRNTGIKHINGQLVAFLDDDDEWLPANLEKQVQLLLNLPKKVGMVYCWMDYYNQAGDIMKEVHPNLSGSIFKETLDKQPIGNSSTLLLRRVVIDDIGVFDELLPRGNDGDFIRRVCQTYEVDFVPEVLVKIHVGHEYDRITEDSKRGIKNAIYGQKVKLIKFGSELESLPKQKSSIYSYIGSHYYQLGQQSDSKKYFLRAFKTYPLNLSIYKLFFRSFFDLNNVKKPQE